jgi:putative inorganic carbon (hco3(-)) transporter
LGISALQKRKSIKLVLWGLFALSAYCLLFSYSREAYVGVLVGLFFLGLVRQRWVLLALAVFLMTWQTFVPMSVQERVLMTYDKNEQQLDTSAQDRVVLWDDAMNLFHQNPALGAGFDTYQWQHRIGGYTDTHNYFLKVLVETGVLGLMFFVFLLARMTRLGVKLYRTAQDPFLQSIGLGFALLMACVFVVNFFGDRWLYVEVNGFLWVILACVVRGQMIESERKEPAAIALEAPPEPLPWEREEEPALV